MSKYNKYDKRVPEEEEYYRVFTLRNGTKRRIKIEPWRPLQGELKKLGITESDIFQMQMVQKKDLNG
ncbi:hypothetical protein C2I27_03360 [Priestia megaterium]|uniref:hypothetical protein n=1 Tax=Priestia megaterium TaxID=1404 RepID=UPI000D50CBB0|nr:hypothetical protein [Priestia megaterium]PVC74936.1 hypothetical protein C2I27_03360 [Priestia megaterium]